MSLSIVVSCRIANFIETSEKFLAQPSATSSHDTSTAMYQRPKSCSKNAIESRRCLRHQLSTEAAHRCPETAAPRRSNSLQNLSPTRGKEQRKLIYKPVKLAWTRKTPSEEGFDYASWGGATAATAAGAFDPFRKSERKSIDIFLSRGFIDPGDVLPSPDRSSLARMFAAAAKRDAEPASVSPPEEVATFTVPPEPSRYEKKVTFALETVDDSKKLTAEARRQQFRNSHSKGSKSSVPAERSDGGGASGGGGGTAKSSVSSSESLDVESRPSSVSPNLVKQSSVERLKQATAKRKLKSGRSRSFHKSLDSSSAHQMTEALPFVKPLKADHPEVVTMVSLLTGEDREHAAGASGGKESKDTTTAESAPRETVSRLKPERHFKSGILKAKSHTDGKIVIPQTVPKPKLFIASKSFAGAETGSSSNPCSKGGLEKPRNNSVDNSECEKTRDRGSIVLKQPVAVAMTNEPYDALQSQKEKECWSSFRKMTNKGLFVSFDTILRGLLTPTEYRLRKHELSAQE